MALQAAERRRLEHDLDALREPFHSAPYRRVVK